MNSPAEKPQFLILLRHPTGPTPSPEELQKIMARFAGWMDGIRQQGAVVSSNGLEGSGMVLRGPGGASATDGPYVETKELVGGYVLFTADNWDGAVKLARACPGLDYGVAIEVRAVRPHRCT